MNAASFIDETAKGQFVGNLVMGGRVVSTSAPFKKFAAAVKWVNSEEVKFKSMNQLSWAAKRAGK